MTVRGSGTHFRSVGWQPRNFETRIHTRFCQPLAEEEHALAAETGNPDAPVSLSVSGDRLFRRSIIEAEDPRNVRDGRRLWRHRPRQGAFHAVAIHTRGVDL